jgi:glycosyltransferase involved in cell wall biosynthesis
MSRASLISVVVPIYNGANWILETLASIFAQTHSQFELILVDDASTDELASVLASVSDTRLRLLRLDKNGGVANARNAGVRAAGGEYIAFCDADDICLPNRFALQLAYLVDKPQAAVCGSGFVCFSADGDLNTVQHPTASDAIRRNLMAGNCFGMSTMMGRAAVFKQYAFDQSFTPSEDYELWTRMATNGIALANLPEALVRYRIHPTQASQQRSDLLDRLATRIRAMYCARILGLPQLQAQIQSNALTVPDMLSAAQATASYCRQHQWPVASFRFMLSWLYQNLPSHGLGNWWTWQKIQRDLGLQLDSNYKLNIAVLAFLPKRIRQRLSPVLLKLKR